MCLSVVSITMMVGTIMNKRIFVVLLTKLVRGLMALR